MEPPKVPADNKRCTFNGNFVVLFFDVFLFLAVLSICGFVDENCFSRFEVNGVLFLAPPNKLHLLARLGIATLHCNWTSRKWKINTLHEYAIK